MAQMAAATFLILACTSAALPWIGLSVDPVVFTPAMALLLCYLNLLFSIGSGQAAFHVAGELLAGSCLGAGIGVGINYAALSANGGSREDSVTKVGLMVFVWGERSLSNLGKRVLRGVRDRWRTWVGWGMMTPERRLPHLPAEAIAIFCTRSLFMKKGLQC